MGGLLRRRIICAAVAALGISASAQLAKAAVVPTLAGFMDYPVTATTGAENDGGYLYNSNNSSYITGSRAYINDGGSNQASGIAFSLTPGSSTTFTVSNLTPTPAGHDAAIVLMFTDNGSTFPATTSGVDDAPPEIVAYESVGGPSTPLVTTVSAVDFSSNWTAEQIDTFGTYNSALSYTDADGFTYTLTSFSVNAADTGETFTISVSPEPASAGLVLLALCGLILTQRAGRSVPRTNA